MTPYEFSCCVNGYNKRNEEDMQKNAWLAAAIINAIPNFSKHRKKPVTPNQLLDKKDKTFTSAKAFREYMRQKQEEQEAGY